jgi:hypothetical protein
VCSSDLVGETLEERNAGKIEEVVFGQLDTALSDVRLFHGAQLIVAYEPVWAIGTGVNATNEQIEQAHRLIREHLKQLLGTAIGGSIAILYGGSVKPANFSSIAGLPSVDGGLIGGASLKPSAFAELIGLVNRAVPRDTVLATALAVADEIASCAPIAVRGAKRALARAGEVTLEAQLDFEAEQQAVCYESADLAEGLRAVREKRSPRFEGR